MLDELFEIAHGGDSSSSEGPSQVLPAPSKDKELQDPPLSPPTDIINDVLTSLKANKDITLDSTEHNTETAPSTRLTSTEIILSADSVAIEEAAPSIDPSTTGATLSADLAVANEVAPSTILTHTETHMSGKIEEGVIVLNQEKRGRLRDQVQLVKRKDCDRYEIVPIRDPLSFEKGFFIVIRACQLLVQKNDGIILVGLAGPSGAGKTIFTEKILNFMPSIAVISMDNYNDSSRIVDGNIADPRLTDYDTLLKNVHDLKEGKQVQVPIYDFKSCSRTGYRTLEVPGSRVVIIEGIYALSEKLQPLLDLRVSITGGVHYDLVKQVLRDMQHAGQEPEEIIHQISGTVYPMYKAFIEPDLQTAHIKIINNFNPFTGFQGPTYVLKAVRNVTVDQIKAILSEGHTETMEQTNDIYLLPPGEDLHSCQSYLRMRNNDGKYRLMFEQWVTDSPFLISPRITFEVSVRLLGGLMALGYTIATILKRSSHVFSNERVCVKIDWLEQLNRRYIQVQGRDRLVVKYVAEQLGLEGSYTPRTYIEQIQLEKDVNEVMALPEDSKTKLSLDENLASSPKEALSHASTDRAAMRNKHLKRWLSHSYSTQRDEILSKPTGFLTNNQRFDDRNSESPATLANQHIIDINSAVMNHGTHQRDDAWSQKVNLEWIFVITNFVLELPSAVFDQLSSVHKPLYARISMFMSFIAMLVSIIELIYKGRKERVTWRWTGTIPWFYHPSPSNMRFGTFTDIVGLACAIPQFIAATITYSFALRNADNPIKMSVWPIIFAFGLLCSKLSENPNKRTSSLKRDS